jgi:transposase
MAANPISMEYPKIKALARKEKAEIYFGDAAPMRVDHHAGRTWGRRGETPIVQATGARYGMSLISAVTARGRMRFMIIEKGSVNAGVFIEFLIEFLKRLIKNAGREIFLIVDRSPAYRAKKAGAFVPTPGGKLRLFFLPPYAPDRHPDELAWSVLQKHMRGGTAGTRRSNVKGEVQMVEAMRRAYRNGALGRTDP